MVAPETVGQNDLRVVLTKLKNEVYSPAQKNRVNPFLSSDKGGFVGRAIAEGAWFNKRMIEGSFGPLASFDKSVGIENRSETLVDSVRSEQKKWKETIGSDRKSAEKQKSAKVEELRKDWETIEKGGAEEEKWLAEALGMTTAFFEDFIKGEKPGFEFWDNQILYMSLMDLEKGDYSFGKLLTHNRAVQLDTGEGKTICSGIIAALKALQGKSSIIVEQNYISVEDHAKKMAPFFQKFLGIETGILTDKSEGNKIIVDRDIDRQTGLITEKKRVGKYDRKSAIFIDGKFVAQEGNGGRKRSWDKQIVYADFNSLGTDAVTDRQIIRDEKDRVQPDLSKRVGLIQEADGLMEDNAINPFQIEDVAAGYQAWDKIAEIVDFGKGEKPDRDTTISFIYSLWANLELMANQSPLVKEWKKHTSFIELGNGEVVTHDEMGPTVEKIITPYMANIFGGDLRKTKAFMKRNGHIIQDALDVVLGHKPYQGFLPDKDPVLTDAYGVPLDNRQLQMSHQIFLQLSNIWENLKLNDQEMTPELLGKVVKDTWATIKVPKMIANTALPSVLFREFGELKATSGSLLPISQTMADIYEAETIAVSRHQPIEQVENEKKLNTVCLDGGLAELDFSKDPFIDMYKRIEDIRKSGQAGLIILPDMPTAFKLFESVKKWRSMKPSVYGEFEFSDLQKVQSKLEELGQIQKGTIRLITGREEYKERGSLEKITSFLDQGDIIITTQIAHRDIDPRLSQTVVENGGLTSVVYNSPNERGLWQALQRAVRADVPGKRVLVFGEDSFYLAKNMYLFDKNPVALTEDRNEMHAERQKRIEKLWAASLQGNLDAQRELFRSYINFLRYQESGIKDTILFNTVRERYLDDFQKKFLKDLSSGRKKHTWQSFVDYTTYKRYLRHRDTRPGDVPVETFLTADTDKKRVGLLKDMKLFGNMEYHGLGLQVNRELLQGIWSDVLDALPYLYENYRNQSPTRPQPHTITEWENYWRNYLEQYLDQISIAKYAKTKTQLTFGQR